ncbi:hypothetical protein [Mesorhizobium sp. ES1-3]|uniref:hypothetical protein n=1 Tax=Mesorhizobium sp. ES1-3 TaxID=2876628 RepID=UPI001CCA6607|nr:hypothetical protein [Mesorhizobium sp. ES1-3]MBZ9669864.1 hypothetical protein [Mesorhizobium sp. ES1-3]
MNGDTEKIGIIRLHEKWADFYTIVAQVLILSLFAGVCFLAEQTGVDAAERSGAFVLLGPIILGTVIWQAAGFGLARIHMIINGIDLERGSTHDERTRG